MDKKNYGCFLQTANCQGPQYLKFNKPADANMLSASNESDTITVLYFGAGRGPLIRSALDAARRAEVYDRVKVIALDKNPNAIITLRSMIIDEKLEDKVTLFAGDMRKVEINQL